MVSTRNHPREFPEPTPSPTKRSITPTTTTTTTTTSIDAPFRTSPSLRPAKRMSKSSAVWSHTPSNLTLIWLAISLPLVIWDTGYVMGRPHTMSGGKWVWPLYTPYELYGTIDHIYGFPAWNAHNGFTAAQGTLNVIETAMYFVYVYIVYKHGQQEDVEGRGAPSKSVIGQLGAARTVYGRNAGLAVVIAFSAALMTLSKTVLYWLNEAFSGFDNIGHNDASTLFFMWIIPNGAWIAFPIYMCYVLGSETLEGLEIASGESKKTQ